MPLQATSGAASYDAFGGGVPVVPNYIEECFSCFLYTGNGSTQTITNGIDLSGKGGLVWAKTRDFASSHALFDTVRGGSSLIGSNSSNAPYTGSTYINPFNSNGFTWAFGDNQINGLNRNYVSWTFRKQPKFFDVVTFTSSASGNKTFSHNLGAVPGCVIIKNTQTSDPWIVYHRSVGNDAYLSLNSTAAQDPLVGAFSATSTTFTISSSLMYNSQTYVAYLFAHDAGGFGLTGTDNVISCGSFTTDGSGNATVSLGYEPQWILFKNSSSTGPWYMLDTFRQWSLSEQNYLNANTSNAESPVGAGAANFPTATGFNTTGAFTDPSSTYIYIAIRRGPMKVPTVGTSVFSPVTRTGTGASASISNLSFPPDLEFAKVQTAGPPVLFDRLRGSTAMLQSSSTAAESTQTTEITSFNQTGVSFGVSTFGYTNLSGEPYVNWLFRRAPSFFDEVCYTGNGTTLTLSHNLTVPPELFIIKCRDGVTNWSVPQTFISGGSSFLALNAANGISSAGAGTVLGNNVSYVAPTATVFTLGSQVMSNNSGFNYVAYLFATCAGVSKVGSYTGNGSSQTIGCGFTGGARFVLIKRTDSTGDWYVWDSARGIVAGNDPYLLLNSTAAEVTSTDYIDPVSTGFEISSTAPAAINASGGTFIFLAIA